MLPAAFLGLARIHSPKFSPSQQIPGQFMALRTSSSGCKGLMADFEYIWGQLAISVARRLWEAGLRGPDFARHWRASFKRRNATRRELRCSENWVGLRESRRCWELSEEMKRAAPMKKEQLGWNAQKKWLPWWIAQKRKWVQWWGVDQKETATLI